MWEWALGPLFFMTILEHSPPSGGGERSDPLKKITELVAELAAPAVEEAGCSLWDVEYVREGGTWYLRIYIDKPGGVDILDCETVSRAVEPLLDEADPIQGSYTFEVSSAGAEPGAEAALRLRPVHGQPRHREDLSGEERPEGVRRDIGRLRRGQRRRDRHRREGDHGLPQERDRPGPAAGGILKHENLMIR